MHCCIEKNLENELLLDDIDEKKNKFRELIKTTSNIYSQIGSKV